MSEKIRQLKNQTLPPELYTNGVDFPIRHLVQRKIPSPYMLEELLLQMPFKTIDLSGCKFGHKDYEFVELDNVVGALTGNNWFFYDGNDARDSKYQYSLMEALRNGTCGLTGDKSNPEPINMYELDGSYYVSQGRHRVAILKVMLVPFIPVSVQHLHRS